MNYLELQNYHNDDFLSATADNVCKSITIAATVCITRLFHISMAATVTTTVCIISRLFHISKVATADNYLYYHFSKAATVDNYLYK